MADNETVQRAPEGVTRNTTFALFAKIAGRWKYYGRTPYHEDAENFASYFNDDLVEKVRIVDLEEEDD